MTHHVCALRVTNMMRNQGVADVPVVFELPVLDECHIRNQYPASSESIVTTRDDGSTPRHTNVAHNPN